MTKHPRSLGRQGQNSHHRPSRRATTSMDAVRGFGRPRIAPEQEPQSALNVSGPLKDTPTIDDHAMNENAIPVPVLSGNEIEMRTMCLTRLSWRSYARLCTVICMCIGFAASIVFFLLAFVINVDFSVHIGNVTIGGRLFSTVAVFIAPFFGGAIGFATSFMTRPLFTQILQRFSGLPLTGQWLDSEKYDARG